MDNTIGYYIEKIAGVLLGIAIGVCFYFHWFDGSVLLKDKYYDVIIKLSASVFGFLLTILALIVNSSSPSVVAMREHDNYPRLIKSNRAAVFLSFVIILYSVMMYLIISPANGIQDFESRFTFRTFKILVSVHTVLCVWSAIDTAIFVRIFYKIILFGTRKSKT